MKIFILLFISVVLEKIKFCCCLFCLSVFSPLGILQPVPPAARRNRFSSDQSVSLWTFFWTCPTGRRQRTDPGHSGGSGGMASLPSGLGAALGAPQDSQEEVGDEWDASPRLPRTPPATTHTVTTRWGRCGLCVAESWLTRGGPSIRHSHLLFIS